LSDWIVQQVDAELQAFYNSKKSGGTVGEIFEREAEIEA